MNQAKSDENYNSNFIGVSETVSTTPTNIAVDSTTCELLATNATSQTLQESRSDIATSVYDYISLSYTNMNLAVAIFKMGGGTVLL